MNVMSMHDPLIRLTDVNLVRPILKAPKHDMLAKQGFVGGRIDHSHNKTSVHALRDVTLTVHSGTRLGIIGPNGSGKTTLLRVMAGIYQPTSGTCIIRGQVAALLAGAMGLNPDTTGQESIRFVGELYGVKDARSQAFVEEVSEFSGLGEYLEFPIRTYSSGMRTRLGLSILTGIQPDILVLDEVLSAGDRSFRKHARDRFTKLATSVKILVLASHSFPDIQEFCDRAIYIEQGRIEYSGSCEETWECYERSSSGPGGAQTKAAPKAQVGTAQSPAIPSGEKTVEPEQPARFGEPVAQEPANDLGGAVPRHPRPAKRSASRAEHLVAIARKVGAPQEVADSLGTLTGLPELEALSMLLTHAPSVAMEQVLRADLEKRYGRDGACLRYLALALFQVPAAEARRVAQGIDSKHIEATLANLGADARSSLERERVLGITLDALKWSQRYLAGDLARIGPLQYDVVPFSGEVRAYRHPTTRQLSVISLAGKAIDEKGNVTDDEPNHEGWELALAPGLPMLQMFLPDDGAYTLDEVGKSIKEAFESFARSKPEAGPLGVFRANWKLDPQVASLFPRNLGTHAMQLGGWLYPAKLSEKRLLRRFFGPQVNRADLARLPRDSLSAVQRGIVDLLEDPDVSLGARGVFILREDFASKYVEHSGESAGGLVSHDSG
jgi:ABC-type polysaccharide/polyol phosphate transport system ATPase subunit